MTLVLHRGLISGGTLTTMEIAAEMALPVKACDLVRLDEMEMMAEYAIRLAHIIQGDRVEVLNVAGPRESKAPGIEADVAALLTRTFRVLRAAQGG